MNTRARLIGLAARCALLLVVFVLLAASPTQAGQPAPVVDRASLGDAILHPTTDITVTTVNISNEPPGYLIDYLYNTVGITNCVGAIGYLKDHSNGIISQEFYDHLVNAPRWEAFLTLLRDYTSPFSGTIQVGEDGTAKVWVTPPQVRVGNNYIPLDGRHFANVPGWTLSASQNGQFSLTYAQDPADYPRTYSIKEGSINYNYYTFAIAWRAADPTPTPTATPTPTPTATPTPISGQRMYLPLVVRY